ncbi:MAG: hypothetical protein SF187_04690 [Deltaproteobacteria bacterium]|nr:hypothetical protein [Deltaproteobacteria bacterium]
MASVTGVVAALAYPAFVYVGLTRFGLTRAVWLVVIVAAVLAAARALSPGRRRVALLLAPPLTMAGLAVLGAWTKQPRLLLATPTLINGSFLLTFGVTLRPGAQPIVERFARMLDPGLTEAEAAYCRQVTKLWCWFFVLNGTAAAVLAVGAPLSWWALYTGLLAYVLMGLLMAGEYVVRKRRFGKFGRGPHDRMLAFLMAPRAGRS